MQNGLGESFWDGLGVEIGACANFTDFPGIRGNFPDPEKMPDPRKNLRLDALGRYVWPGWAGHRPTVLPDFLRGAPPPYKAREKAGSNGHRWAPMDPGCPLVAAGPPGRARTDGRGGAAADVLKR